MKIKRTFFALIPLLALVIISGATAQQKFYLDLNNRADDLFKVVLIPEKLSAENNIFQFASTAPGTYERMDIGRFVKSFKAFDKDGGEIKTENVSVNQWNISSPEKTARIEYNIEDTWDAKVKSNHVYLMCGSNIEDDNVLINGQCVFGYFHGMQSEPIKVKINYPADWLLGSALPLDSEGYYDAKNYDQIVDSPILLGNLTKASTNVGGSEIDIYTFSKKGLIKSDDLLSSIDDILEAESDFMEGLPVKRYTFLFHFEKISNGAWEHSYSSEYVYKEDSLTAKLKEDLRSTVSHEFFHIVTPLNIHSELVAKFNFVNPVMSRHLWLYEGVTEWASQILQLRGGLYSLSEYLNDLKRKITVSGFFSDTVSLTNLGVHSTEMHDQYPNIYMRGAVTAGLLDIRLLELSHGTRGLREVINELAKIYGPDSSFSEKTFFDDFTKMTYPEIADFFDRYIKHAEPLPIKEYYTKLGISYQKIAGYDSTRPAMGIEIGLKDQRLFVKKVADGSANKGIVIPGDIIDKYKGTEVTMHNADNIFKEIKKKMVGDEFNVTVIRNGEEKEITLKLGPTTIRNTFEVDPDAAPEQLKLREAWMKNL